MPTGMITLGSTDDRRAPACPALHPNRCGAREAVQRVGARLFAQRAGGYTASRRSPPRGDAAPLSIVELTEQLVAPTSGETSKDKKSKDKKK